MNRETSRKDILSGLIFVGLGAAFGVAAAGYEIGSALRMGPGFFPLVLAGILVALGAAIVLKGLRAAAPDSPLEQVPWRALTLIFAAIIVFGATVRGLGLAPSLLVSSFLAALASRSNGPAAAALLALGLTAACIVIFVVGLGVPVPALGPWVR